jgi:hypothetical protein
LLIVICNTGLTQSFITCDLFVFDIHPRFLYAYLTPKMSSYQKRKEDYQMRTILMIAAILGAFLLGQVLAAPTAKYLIDATPGESLLIHLDEWFANNPIKEGQASRSDNVFIPPRCRIYRVQ